MNQKEPMTQLQEGAAQLHELFITYVAAGFTRKEAVELLKAILVTALTPPRQ